MKVTRQLIINNISVDFFADDQDIPLTFEVNNLGDLQSLQGNGSKQFKLPLTQKNRIALGFPDDVTFGTNIAYEQSPAKFIEDGIEVVSNGKAEIQDVQDNYADVLLLFGNVDFLDSVGGQIYDMGDSTTVWSGYGTSLVWKPYDHIWNVANAANSQKKTDGWIWPIVNYGDISSIPPFNGLINVRNQRPGFFLHTAIELIVQSTGYTINYEKSCIYNDPVFANLYKKLIIQFGNGSFDHGSDYQNNPNNISTTFTKGVDQVISNPRVTQITSSNIYTNGYPFEGVISFGPSDHYVATKNVNFTASVVFNLYVRGKIGGSQPTEVIIKFVVVNTDGTFSDLGSSSFTLDSNSTYTGIGSGSGKINEENFLNQKLSQTFELVQGQKLYIKYHINNLGQTKSDTYAIFSGGATYSILVSNQEVLWNDVIQCERILPSIGMLDLIKDTLQRQGLILIADPNSGTITFTSLKTIVANKPVARDWSDKCKDMGKQIAFQLGSNYSQVNWLRYQQDSAIPINILPLYSMDDHIDINDKTLNPTVPVSPLFTSAFGPTLNTPYIGGTMAQLSDPTSTDTFSVGNAPRILVDEKLDLSQLGPGGTSKSVTFADGDAGFNDPANNVVINDIISVPYFYKPDAPNLSPASSHLSFKDQGNLPGLRSVYYSELQNVLTQTKKTTRYFLLNPADVKDFDFTIPVYLRQDGCYYYVSKIDSWINGVVCKVDLIKL